MYSNYYTDNMKPEELEMLKEIRTVDGLLEYCLEAFGEREAITSGGKTVTYKEFYEDVELTRGFLVSNGINKGDHVGIMLKNEYDFMRVYMATVTLGCVAVLVPMQTPVENVLPLCKGFDVNMLVHSRVFGGAYKAMNPSIPVFSQDEVTSTDKADKCGDITPDTPATIIFTGGTTGKSKGVLLSHGNLMRGTVSSAYGTRNGFFARYYAIIPFTHVFGLIRSGLAAFYTGSYLFMCEDMKNIFKDLPVAKPTYLILVPGLAELVWSIMAQRGKEAVGGQLDVIICGASAVPQKLVDRLAQFDVMLHPGYGLTESSNLVSGNVYPDKYPGSVGRAYGYQELKVVDGELWLKGENVMLGYYNDPKANEEAFCDGWFKTGDLVDIDDEGNIYIVGRIKNVIILDNGENVSPEAIEDKLCELPFIQAAFAYEGKNDAGKPIIAVQIFPAQAALKAMNCEDPLALIQSAVDKFNASVPSYMRVAKVTLRDEDFPRSGSMKIIRNQVQV
ncbi:MAG: AMP-binding protein [Clostridia bacterium]|nr:AMP-binding protein [Clostridia bacterium]